MDAIDFDRLLADDPNHVDRFAIELERLALAIARRRYRLAPAEAEDVLIAVVHKLWDDEKAALRAWRREGTLRSYVASIVHRHCLLHLRRQLRLSVEIATDSLDSFEAPTPTEPWERGEMLATCRDAAARLSPRDREMLALRFAEGRDYEEIIGVTGLSYGAARKAVHSAVRRLREQVREVAPEYFAA